MGEPVKAPKFSGQFRDHVTGQYAFTNDWGRMCRCGHTLGVHVAGGFDCLNAEKSIGPEHTGEPCDCEKFRPVRSRRRTARTATDPRGGQADV